MDVRNGSVTFKFEEQNRSVSDLNRKLHMRARP